MRPVSKELSTMPGTKLVTTALGPHLLATTVHRALSAGVKRRLLSPWKLIVQEEVGHRGHDVKALEPCQMQKQAP